MHLIRRITSSFGFVLCNTPVIGLPVYTIAHYIAIGNCGRDCYSQVYMFVCRRLLGNSVIIPGIGMWFISGFTVFDCTYTNVKPGILWDGGMYPAGTHIPLK